MRYFIDRTLFALWAWKHAAEVHEALLDLRIRQRGDYPADYLLDRPDCAMPGIRDNCQICDGTQGVRGNENIMGKKLVCDYCAAKGMP